MKVCSDMKTKPLIHGCFRDTSSSFLVFNPATDKKIAEVGRCSEQDTADAIESACSALSIWRETTPFERCRYLNDLAEAMIEKREQLMHLVTEEQGKPLKQAKEEVYYGASFLQWCSKEGTRIYGHMIPSSSSIDRVVVFEPIGTCVGITPWNFPLAMITRKLGASLAAGCTLIVKPSEETPLCALALGRTYAGDRYSCRGCEYCNGGCIGCSNDGRCVLQ